MATPLPSMTSASRCSQASLHRLPRPERRRQVDHHAPDPRARQRDARAASRSTARRTRCTAGRCRRSGRCLTPSRSIQAAVPQTTWLSIAQSNHIGRKRIDEVLELLVVHRGQALAGGSRSAWDSGSASATALLGDPSVRTSTSRSTDSTRKGSSGSATCCVIFASEGSHGAGVEPPDQRDGADCGAARRHRPRHADRRHKRRRLRGAPPGRRRDGS